MPKRQRDYKAEYRARKAREAERGFSSPSQAQRARQAGRAPAVRQGRRQVYRKGDRGTVTTTAAGRGLGVVERTIDQLDAGAPVTVYATMKVAGGGERMFTAQGTAGALQGASGDALRGAVADAVTDSITGSGHKRAGAAVQAFDAGDVIDFQVAW